MTEEKLLSLLKDLNAPSNLLYLCYRGSVSHNTYVPNTDPNSVDDIDLLGVFISPPEYYIGLSQHKLENPTTIEVMKEINGILYDCVFYEIRHFIGMALRCNPNIFSALWVSPEYRLITNHHFVPFLFSRNIFVGKQQLFKSFTGYANGQLKEMTQYNKSGYMGEKRKKIIDKFGYDVKNASHLVRLLHMGIEALNTGEVKVLRDVDANMLIDIKLGRWKLDEVQMYSHELFRRARKAYEDSTLREEPDVKTAEQILMTILLFYLNNNNI